VHRPWNGAGPHAGAYESTFASAQAKTTAAPAADFRLVNHFRTRSSYILLVALYEHTVHPRVSERQRQGPAKVADIRARGKGPLGRFNARFGLFITVIVGTMWCAYLFTLLALVSLPSAVKSHNTIIIVAWIAQTFLQLVLLPIIIVGQNVQAAASDQRATDTYKDAEAVLHEAIQIQQHLNAQDTALEKILEHLGLPH